MPITTDPLDALLAVRDGQPTARWNFPEAVGTPVSAPGGIGSAVTLTFSFPGALPAYYAAGEIVGFKRFTAAESDAARAVLEVVSQVARVDFVETAGTGALTFAKSAQSGSAGFAYLPAFGYGFVGDTITSVTAQSRSGDVWLSAGAGWGPDDFQRGGDAWATLLHEVGHALGLKHPFEATPGGSTLDPAFDNQAWTMMSYTPHPKAWFRDVTDQGGGAYSWTYRQVQPETPMPLDIAALQHLYGANTGHARGDDTYTFDPARPFIATIWDAAGSDTISVAGFTRPCEIDLRAGAFSTIRIPSDALPSGVADGRTDVYDGTDNLAIAYGTVIENATGGSGNDTLTGNGAANRLDGRGGADRMAGGNGSDTYFVAEAGDVVIESNAESAGGVDLVRSRLPACTLGTNVENGRIDATGTAALRGNGLANVLTAGAGNNTLDGAGGNDTASYGSAAAGVTVSLAVATAQATGGSGLDFLVSIENLRGSAHADTLAGNSGANQLRGGAGADRLTGGAGADRFVLDSRSGTDRLIDHVSGVDRIAVAQSGLRIGDGDTVVDGARTVAGPGGFAPSAEWVVLTRDISGSLGTEAAAKAIGSAGSAYKPGATALFAVDNGSASGLFLFTSAAADAKVSAAELTWLATLPSTPSLAAADLFFVG
jgi:Ca2+-binding RTX toxin-like protein